MINSFGYLLYFCFALPIRLPTVLSYLEQFFPAPDVPLSHQTLAPYGRGFPASNGSFQCTCQFTTDGSATCRSSEGWGSGREAQKPG